MSRSRTIKTVSSSFNWVQPGLEVTSASSDPWNDQKKEEVIGVKAKRDGSPACAAKKQKITRVTEKNIHGDEQQR